MIDVVMLMIFDWANTGWRFAKCLEMIGLRVFAFKGWYHQFGYAEQVPIHPDLYKEAVKFEGGAKNPMWVDISSPHLSRMVESTKVVHFRDTCVINTGINLEDKLVVVQHGGRAYRVNHKLYNDTFGYFIDKTIIQMPDILGKGAPNEELIYYPVQCNHPLFTPNFKRASKDHIILGHFPTSQFAKGSEAFVRASKRAYKEYNNLRFIGTHSFSQADNMLLLWPDHLKRVQQCDVILETCAEVAQGKPFGEWGNQCIEAAALGKIVITNSHSAELYRKEYGEGFAPRIANNEDDVYRHLCEIGQLSDAELMEEKERSRKWVEKYHSMEATAQRLWDKIYKDLLG